MDAARAAEWVWYGRGPTAAAARAALAPAELLFRAGAALRSALYDAGLARAHPLGRPSISVGNLTVGGTGKTPMAAWVCAELRRRGARPALLIRGVGDDEPRVHALLNPDVPVFADPDRVRAARAAVSAGADVLVLDDAFQHRRARRDVDVVLASAERGLDGRAPGAALPAARRLPAGPHREGYAALRRASAVVVTRKSAPLRAARALADALAQRAPGAVVAVAHLAADALRPWSGWTEKRATEEGRQERPLHTLAEVPVLAVAGIGEPDAFAAQLAAAGARVRLRRYPDHHRYTARDAAAIAAAARDGRVVTTLKDAVKLGPLWPHAAPPLWYVTQRVIVEDGGAGLAARLDVVAAAARAGADAVPPP